jgi:hydroxypyruvate isomerase
MRFEPNLSILFTELPLEERPAAAAAAGFDAAELWWPFRGPEPEAAAVDGLVGAFESAGLRLACLNFDAGDMAAGDRGLLAVAGAEARFRANIDVAVELADRLGCRTINALYGSVRTGELRDDLAIDNLTRAVAAASRIGARVVIEAINPVDNPGYGLPAVAEVVAFLDRVRDRTGAEGWISFDAYHAAMAGEQLPDLVARHGGRFAHVQLADVPGRHEPGTGSMDMAGLLGDLEAIGYDGWVGLEYVPTTDSATSVATTMTTLTTPSRRAS